MATTIKDQPQEVLVSAIAPALPGYNLTSEQWLRIALGLRMTSRNSEAPHGMRLFLEDVARAADAMHNRLSGSTEYAGREELDKALGPIER